jgi:hypothetical protein
MEAKSRLLEELVGSCGWELPEAVDALSRPTPQSSTNHT